MIYKINNHDHFIAKYFAADEESGFNGFHQAAFNKYYTSIDDALNGKVSIEKFINLVYTSCYIFPVIDMLHASKSGRNRLMILPIKLGENCDLFNSIMRFFLIKARWEE